MYASAGSSPESLSPPDPRLLIVRATSKNTFYLPKPRSTSSCQGMRARCWMHHLLPTELRTPRRAQKGSESLEATVGRDCQLSAKILCSRHSLEQGQAAALGDMRAPRNFRGLQGRGVFRNQSKCSKTLTGDCDRAASHPLCGVKAALGPTDL